MKRKNDILFFLLSCYMVLVPVLPSTLKLRGVPINSNILLVIILSFYTLRLLMDKDSKKKFVNDFYDFLGDYSGKLLLAMIMVMLISAAVAFDKKVAVKESLRFISYIMLFFIVKYELDDFKTASRLLKISMLMSTLVAALGIFEFLLYSLNLKITTEGPMMISSTLDNSNMLGAFLMLSLFPTIVLALKERNMHRRVPYIISSVILCAGIFLTDSRNALLGLFLGAALLSIMYSRRILLYALGIGGVSLFIPGVMNRLTEITNMTLNESRIKLWKTAYYMIKDHPILGIGNGNFPYVYESYIKIHKELKHYYYVVPMHPHNLLLDIQTELGIIGTVIFILLLVSLAGKFKGIQNNIKDGYLKYFYSGYGISLCVFFFMNLFDCFFSAPKIEIYLWVLLAIYGAIIYNSKIQLER